jgi:hypothetical protein
MPTFTLADLKTMVYNRLDNNTELYPAADVTLELNDAIRTWNLYTGAIQTSVHVPGYTVANQILYSTPVGILVPLRVTYEGRQLAKDSLTNMGRLRHNWVRETTASSTSGPVSTWIPIGRDTFAIYPADRLGGNDLVVTGIAEPTPLAADADVITLPQEDADNVSDLASTGLLFIEGGKTFADGSMVYQRFLGAMKKKARWQQLKMPRYFLLGKVQGVQS